MTGSDRVIQFIVNWVLIISSPIWIWFLIIYLLSCDLDILTGKNPLFDEVE